MDHVMNLFFTGSDAEQSCPVTVVNGKDAVNASDGYSYKSALTPAITDVSPRRGGTAGGTRLTITGSGFRCGREPELLAHTEHNG